ncbi:MAG: 16S rRNA (cytosine(1402)-N(4))-methyltransferase, partial [Candidatus Raymondbacteria bacterium RifOxyC12_full_50_8]
MGENSYHIPVLVEEIMGYFSTVKNGVVVDGTLGGGGHSHALLSHFPEIRLVGLDKDPAAISAARNRLEPFSSRALLLNAGFETLPAVAHDYNLGLFAGVLLDLGLSSRQIDDPSRGFSFSHSGPLDMRFNAAKDAPAYTVINTFSESELHRLFRELGEEPRSAAVARAIVAARTQGPIETTGALAAIVAGVCRGDIKAKARIFQALRIAVNGELAALSQTLEAVPQLLR